MLEARICRTFPIDSAPMRTDHAAGINGSSTIPATALAIPATANRLERTHRLRARSMMYHRRRVMPFLQIPSTASGGLEVLEHQLHAGDAVVFVDAQAVGGVDLRRRALGVVELDRLVAAAAARQLELEVLVLQHPLAFDA